MIVSIIPDRFNKVTSENASLAKSGNAFSNSDVRRPVRGIQLKEDSYATLRVIMGDGSVLPLVNAGSRNGVIGEDGKLHSDDYSNFLIQGISEERAEKQQIVETFGEAFVFFFGERPRVLSIQGVLINTFDFNWEAEWWWNYDNYLRGTKCVENDARVYIVYDEVMVSGYIMNASSQRQAQERNFVPFSFQLFVTDYTNLSRLGDPDADQTHKTPLVGYQQIKDYLPQLVPVNMNQYLNSLNGTTPSLIEAMTTDAVASVQAAWSKVNQLVNNTISSVDSILGNPVRIPQGFEGALAFDTEAFKLDLAASEGLAGEYRAIRYTVFGDNLAEFVGAGSPYDSSSTELGRALYNTFSGVNEFNSMQQMVTQAYEQWTANGFIIPSSALTKAIALASQTGVGMQVIGGARALLAGGAAAAGEALAVGDSVVAGTSQLLGNAALADSLVGDISPSASASLDRAAAQTAPTSFEVLNGLKSFAGF